MTRGARADTKKHGRRLSAVVVDRISALVFQGYKTPQVQEVLEAEFGEAAPDIRTTRRHVRDLQEHFGKVQEHFGTVRARRRQIAGARSGRAREGFWDVHGPGGGEDGAVEPDVGTPGDPRTVADLLPVLRAGLAAGHPWPSEEAIRWWAWLRRLAPDLPPTDVPTLAATWRARQATGRPTRDLLVFLATAPWRGRSAFDAYLDTLVRWPLPASDSPALYPWWQSYPQVAGAWLAAVAVRLAWLLPSLCAEVAARVGQGEPWGLDAMAMARAAPKSALGSAELDWRRPTWVPESGPWGFDWHGLSVAHAAQWLTDSLAWYRPRLACLRRVAAAFLLPPSPPKPEAEGSGGGAEAPPLPDAGGESAGERSEGADEAAPAAVTVEPPPPAVREGQGGGVVLEMDRVTHVHRLFDAAAASIEAVLTATHHWVHWVGDWHAGRAEQPPFPRVAGGPPWMAPPPGFPTAEEIAARIPNFPGERLAPGDVWRAVVESVAALRQAAPVREEVDAVPFPFVVGLAKIPFPSPGGMTLPGAPQ
jgi:hypothetical protein